MTSNNKTRLLSREDFKNELIMYKNKSSEVAQELERVISGGYIDKEVKVLKLTTEHVFYKGNKS